MALDKATSSGGVPEESDAVAILQDGGLEEELNAAAAGGLVETERDRLIRLVSPRGSVAGTKGRSSMTSNGLRLF